MGTSVILHLAWLKRPSLKGGDWPREVRKQRRRCQPTGYAIQLGS